MFEVIIERNVPFVAGYLDILEEFDTKFKEWIIENIGDYGTYQRSYSILGNDSKAIYIFSFFTEEDALAFKLRWV